MQRNQIAILSNASRLVKPNGILIYSTCSLEKEENEDVCKAFLSSSPGWNIYPPNVPREFLTTDGFARTYPHRDGLDGFFIATFQRS
jgi:16S rRNA (cytosine967-C5)-methyltransferase